MSNSILVDVNGYIVRELDIMPNTEWFYLPIPVPTVSNLGYSVEVSKQLLNEFNLPEPLHMQTRAFRYVGLDGNWQKVYVEQPRALPPG